jgi:Tfp pilus assembly protein PilN
MLSLLQKSDQASGPLIPAWHPNFRDHERLPDTKVVRTQFFVNFVAIAVAASMLLYFTYQEYRINSIGHQVADWQGQIDTNQKASEQAVALAKKFADETKKIDELDDFMKQRLVLSHLLEHLGNSIPPNLAFDIVDVRDTGVDLRGIAAGTPDEASGHASAYVEQLKQDKYVGGIFEDVVLNRLERDQANGRLTFDVFLRFKGAGAKK